MNSCPHLWFLFLDLFLRRKKNPKINLQHADLMAFCSSLGPDLPFVLKVLIPGRDQDSMVLEDPKNAHSFIRLTWAQR